MAAGSGEAGRGGRRETPAEPSGLGASRRPPSQPSSQTNQSYWWLLSQQQLWLLSCCCALLSGSQNEHAHLRNPVQPFAEPSTHMASSTTTEKPLIVPPSAVCTV